MKNITLSVPEDLLEKSREYAAKHNTSLNEFVRSLLRKYVNEKNESPVATLLKHSDGVSTSQSWKWNRDEVYDR